MFTKRFRLEFMVLVSALLLFAGCDFLLPRVPTSVIPTVYTSVVTNYVTNVAFRTSVVLRDTGEGNRSETVVTNKVVEITPQVSSVTLTNMVTNYVYQVNPAVEQGVEVAKGVGTFLPPPYGTAVIAVLGVFSAILTGFARVKNKQASAGQAIIEAVEKANSPELKKLISNNVRDSQYSNVHSFVKNVTEGRP